MNIKKIIICFAIILSIVGGGVSYNVFAKSINTTIHESSKVSDISTIHETSNVNDISTSKVTSENYKEQLNDYIKNNKNKVNPNEPTDILNDFMAINNIDHLTITVD